MHRGDGLDLLDTFPDRVRRRACSPCMLALHGQPRTTTAPCIQWQILPCADEVSVDWALALLAACTGLDVAKLDTFRPNDKNHIMADVSAGHALVCTCACDYM